MKELPYSFSDFRSENYSKLYDKKELKKFYKYWNKENGDTKQDTTTTKSA